MVVEPSLAGLNLSETVNLLVFSCITVSRVYTEWCCGEKNTSVLAFLWVELALLLEVRGKLPEWFKLTVYYNKRSLKPWGDLRKHKMSSVELETEISQE